MKVCLADCTIPFVSAGTQEACVRFVERVEAIFAAFPERDA